MKIIKEDVIVKKIIPRIITIELTNEETNLITACIGRTTPADLEDEFKNIYKNFKQEDMELVKLFNEFYQVSDLDSKYNPKSE